MIALKKLYGDELLRLALVLSLLKADPNDHQERETQQLIAGLHISNGSDWSLEHEARTLIRPRFVHPKSLDNVLINYERELFEELNSLGRYTDSYNVENNDRIWNNRGPILHTYLLNNVATDTVAAALPAETVPEELTENDAVSADENVAEEVKVNDEERNETVSEDRVLTSQPDAVVTLSADFFVNRSESDIFSLFDEIPSRSFDVNDLLVNPNEMIVKEESKTSESHLIDYQIKKEQNGDLYSDNAIDDFVPYFAAKTDKFELDDPNSVFHQNMADLQDYGGMFEDTKEFKDLEILDVKQQQENLEQYLLENTPLDSEVYELAPMFEEELVLDVKRERASTSFTSASSGVSEMDVSVKEELDVKLEPDEGHHTGDELTQEDMDLIKVLWKQDVDMGFTLEDPILPEGLLATKVFCDEKTDELKTAEERKKEEEDDIEKVKKSLLETEVKEDDAWAGLSYTVDTETGEYVIQGELPEELVTTEESGFDLLEEALQLVELGDDADTKNDQSDAVEGSSGSEMLHPAMRHVPHPLAHYHNQSLMRSMSVEQRWQDLASLLTIPPPPDQYQHYHQHHHPHPHPHSHPHSHNISSGHGATGYTPNYHAPLQPTPDKHPDAYGAAAPIDGAYKVESAHHPQQHDALYYQNATEHAAMPPPPTQDGFLQSILNDEDMQLMDMAMNEGMYTMRMLDGAGSHPAPHHNHSHMMLAAERDSASDSAVSSMGSERVPSLSDSEWCDGSDSAQDFHSSKFRPYDASYGRDRSAMQPQKKHHMFGKRCFQEQAAAAPPLDPLPPRPAVVKYECPEQPYHLDNNIHMHNVTEFGTRHQLAPPHVASLQPPLELNGAHSSHALLQSTLPSPTSRYAYATPERVRHNHTYSTPHLQADIRPTVRDKRVRRMTDGSMSDGGSSATSSGHMSRDEKRAKALGIPMEVHDIINLPMDEFNERLSKHDLSEAQLSLIRDIRRRGKNKVAAQNCRKRKLDQITSLADEVRTVRDRKQRTVRDHHNLNVERQRLKERFAALYRHVFQNLRDPEGRPVSSNQYSLQQAADGNVVLVPKMPQHTDHHMNRTDDDLDRKAKNYEQ